MHCTTYWRRRFQSYLSVGFQKWAENGLLPLAGSWFFSGSGSPAAFLVLKTLHEWGVSRGPHKSWAWSMTPDRHLVSHSRLLSSEASHGSETLLSEMGLPISFPPSRSSEPVFAKSQVCSFLSPTLDAFLRIGFWLFLTKVSKQPQGSGGGRLKGLPPDLYPIPKIHGAQGNYLNFRQSQEMTTICSSPIHG